MSPKEIEKMTGRHMNFKERMAFKILKWKMKSKLFKAPDPADNKYDRMGKWSFLLGVGAFVIGLVRVLSILSIPAAILAIVLGAISLKKAHKRTFSLLGIILGIAFFVLLAILIAAVLTIFSFV
jgi:hypothetical protein